MNEILRKCKEWYDMTGGDCEVFSQGETHMIDVKLTGCALPHRAVTVMSDGKSLYLYCDVATTSAEKYGNVVLLATEMNANNAYPIARVTQSNDGNYKLTLIRFDLVDVNVENCSALCSMGVNLMADEINKFASKISEISM